MYYIGFDLGSSSVKAALIESGTGKTIGVTNYPEEEMAIFAEQTGWAEQDPNLWWKNCCQVTQKLLAQTGVSSQNIKGIGISYQMHGMVIVDRDQQVLRPSIIWCDSRAVEIGNEAFRGVGEDRCVSNLLNSPGNFTLSKLKWVKENEPEIYDKVDKLLLPGDYIAMRLTGETTTTISGLSEGIMWDFKENRPADWLFDYMGISTDVIPTIVPTFSDQGKVTKKAADEIGLPEGIPVLYRAGDQPNNALSLNAFEPGEIAATGGTSGVVYAITDSTKTQESLRINSFAHVNYTKEAPRIGKLLNINGAGIQYSWMKQNMANTNDSYNDMNKLAASVPFGSDGLRILPFGNGAERMLNNQNKGARISNLNFNLHKKEHLFRAALEGIAFSFVYGIDILKNDGVDLSVIRAGNDNLFRSEIFSNTIATLVGADINIIDTTGAVGAARAAGVSSCAFKTLNEAFSDNEHVMTYHPLKDKKNYTEFYEIWKQDLENQYHK
ncbi:FGGY family carbohydrate kinase [Lutimonas halocynthiae]|uniref:xylulokinase n=1 Tax=Lutimonas halocynthiae TaxID=1446477 RepID=UPI0025B61EC1|nr:FGGY family carbohydrate kinase [Lutimonas halocynthiae]MDN3641309.1 FGGY family carbohydrate kinase [Lutimonas halocynthiae]